MSATPRPWRWQAEMEIDAIHATSFNLPARARFRLYDHGDHATGEAANQDEAERIVRAVNAFDALLAVAKAADYGKGHCCGESQPEDVAEALTALDAAHPGWREWTP